MSLMSRMMLFDEESSAYEYNGDSALLKSLGLRTTGFARSGTDLGTVEIYEAEEETYGNPKVTQMKPATTIQVKVYALPAQFWEFTITRPRDEIEELGDDMWRVKYEPVERFVMKTGSGGFSNYWEMAKAVAEQMITLERCRMGDNDA